MRTAHISSFNVPTLIINRTLIEFGMYISPSHKPGPASVLCVLVSLHWREKSKESEKKNARTYRPRTHEFPRERRLSASSHASFRDGRERALVRANEGLTRENTPPRGVHAAHSRVPSIQRTLSRSAKSPFFPPVRWDARTRAHAPSTKTTHRRRSSRARERASSTP